MTQKRAKQKVADLVEEGDAAWAAGRKAEALARYQEAQTVAPGSEQVRWKVVEALFALKRSQELLPLVQEQAARHPNDPLALAWLGNAWLQHHSLTKERESLAQARQAMESCLRRAPHSAVALRGLAMVEWQEGQRKEAVERMRQAIERMQPDQFDYYGTLAYMLMRQGRLREAWKYRRLYVEGVLAR